MPEITRLVERRGRAKVFVNGEYWAELDAAVAAELGLFEGVNLPETELADARVAGERPLAMTRALNVLGYRARAEGELRERPLRAGYGPETVGFRVCRACRFRKVGEAPRHPQRARVGRRPGGLFSPA